MARKEDKKQEDIYLMDLLKRVKNLSLNDVLKPCYELYRVARSKSIVLSYVIDFYCAILMLIFSVILPGILFANFIVECFFLFFDLPGKIIMVVQNFVRFIVNFPCNTYNGIADAIHKFFTKWYIFTAMKFIIQVAVAILLKLELSLKRFNIFKEPRIEDDDDEGIDWDQRPRDIILLIAVKYFWIWPIMRFLEFLDIFLQFGKRRIPLIRKIKRSLKNVYHFVLFLETGVHRKSNQSAGQDEVDCSDSDQEGKKSSMETTGVSKEQKEKLEQKSDENDKKSDYGIKKILLDFAVSKNQLENASGESVDKNEGKGVTHKVMKLRKTMARRATSKERFRWIPTDNLKNKLTNFLLEAFEGPSAHSSDVEEQPTEESKTPVKKRKLDDMEQEEDEEDDNEYAKFVDKLQKNETVEDAGPSEDPDYKPPQDDDSDTDSLEYKDDEDDDEEHPKDQSTDQNPSLQVYGENENEDQSTGQEKAPETNGTQDQPTEPSDTSPKEESETSEN